MYNYLSVWYTQFHQLSDYENQEIIGAHIFNLIMPYAQEFDPRLIKMIPGDTLDKFRIIYDNSGKIKTWHEIEDGNSSSSSSEQSMQLGSDNNSSNDPEFSSNSQALKTSRGRDSVLDDSQDMSHFDNDKDIGSSTVKKGSKTKELNKGILEGLQGIDGFPLSGKNKSLLNVHALNFKHFKHDLKPLDNLFKSLKDDRDWSSFCKMLYLYIEGVLSHT